jgi:hypothetical protein
LAIGGEIEPYASGALAIPFDFRWWARSRWPVIVIAVGPYGDRDRYTARRADLCLRANWHNARSEALLILAEPDALASYEAFRNENRLDFDVIASRTGDFTLEPDRRLQSVSRGQWSRAIVPCAV